MEDLKEKIQPLIENLLDEHHFLVDFLIVPSGNKLVLQIFLDGDQGVNINTCAQVSRRLAKQLEELDWIEQAYVLEVSSPGAESPLRLPRQYKQHVGRSLAITLTNGEALEGKLLDVSNQGILLEKKLSKKKNDTETIAFSFQEIALATVIISMKHS